MFCLACACHCGWSHHMPSHCLGSLPFRILLPLLLLLCAYTERDSYTPTLLLLLSPLRLLAIIVLLAPLLVRPPPLLKPPAATILHLSLDSKAWKNGSLQSSLYITPDSTHKAKSIFFYSFIPYSLNLKP